MTVYTSTATDPDKIDANLREPLNIKKLIAARKILLESMPDPYPDRYSFCEETGELVRVSEVFNGMQITSRVIAPPLLNRAARRARK